MHTFLPKTIVACDVKKKRVQGVQKPTHDYWINFQHEKGFSWIFGWYHNEIFFLLGHLRVFRKCNRSLCRVYGDWRAYYGHKCKWGSLYIWTSSIIRRFVNTYSILYDNLQCLFKLVNMTNTIFSKLEKKLKKFDVQQMHSNGELASEFMVMSGIPNKNGIQIY